MANMNISDLFFEIDYSENWNKKAGEKSLVGGTGVTTVGAVGSGLAVSSVDNSSANILVISFVTDRDVTIDRSVNFENGTNTLNVLFY